MVWKENRENAYCEITPAILALKEQWEKKNYIDPKLYKEYNVKRGLRDEDGRGVLTGLTRVGENQSYSVTEGEHNIPQDGMLYYLSLIHISIPAPIALAISRALAESSCHWISSCSFISCSSSRGHRSCRFSARAVSWCSSRWKAAGISRMMDMTASAMPLSLIHI